MNAIPFRSRQAGALPHEAARQLEALVRETVATGASRQALLLRVSILPRDVAQPHHLRLAYEALEPLLAADRARLYVLPNGDAAMVWRGPAPAPLAASLERLRHLFTDDARADIAPDRLAHLLALPEGADILLAAAGASLAPPPPPAAPPPRAPLDLPALAALEAALAQADLSRFARRRPVCTHAPGQGFRLAWEKRVFCLRELADTLAPEYDLKREPWLFRRLTRTLDRRMMALLTAPQELRHAGPFALALNVASILSPDFLRFDAALPARLRGHVVIELRPEDVLDDTAAFLFAREFAQARGYRLVLGRATAAMAGAMPPAATGIDLVQLAWEQALPDMDLAALGLPADRLVLSGIDSADAMAWARDQGIVLQAGALVRPARARRLVPD